MRRAVSGTPGQGTASGDGRGDGGCFYSERKAPLGDPIVVLVVDEVVVDVGSTVVVVLSMVVEVVATVVEVVVDVLSTVVLVLSSVVVVVASVVLVDVVLGTVVLLTAHGSGSQVPAPWLMPLRALHSSGDSTSQVKAPIELSNAPPTEDGTQHWIAWQPSQQLVPVPTVP